MSAAAHGGGRGGAHVPLSPEWTCRRHGGCQRAAGDDDGAGLVIYGHPYEIQAIKQGPATHEMCGGAAGTVQAMLLVDDPSA